jgi:acyl-[acyl-carrier-protein]-phospholipid O-acyltransferase / long-chain-fatty-acid--[acyl-carrier-protein] ligase
MVFNTQQKKRIPKFKDLFARAKKGEFSFACLNLAQFLGALNDNLFKLLVIFLLISTIGPEESSLIVSIVGAVYVIPFLLFSASAGVLADRFSKQKMIRALKGIEVILTSLAIVAFYTQSTWGCYTLLFLIATHSAVFGPPKYGIIPELVEKNNMTKANGHIITLTYLAIICGTFLASFLVDFTNKSFVLSVSFCLFFSILGLLFSFGIQKTPAQKSNKKINALFFREIFRIIVECRKEALLAPCLFGSAYFLFIGAFTQLNVIPFAIQSLKLSEAAGGYLFLFTALGIAAGTFLANRLLKKKLDLNTSCLSGFCIAVIFFAIWVFSSQLIPVLILLTLLGVFGGVFVVSFDTFIQMNSPLRQRGQMIAAANFLGFFGVLIAAFCLYFFGDLLSLSPAMGFFCMGFITLLSSTFLCLVLLEVFLPFLSGRLFAKKGLKVIDPLKLCNVSSLYVLESFTLSLLWTASMQHSKCRMVILKPKRGIILHLLSLSQGVIFLPEKTSFKSALINAKSLQDNDTGVFIVLNRPLHQKKDKSSLFSFKTEQVCSLRLHKKSDTERVILVEDV